jgi:hypothetical protein
MKALLTDKNFLYQSNMVAITKSLNYQETGMCSGFVSCNTLFAL